MLRMAIDFDGTLVEPDPPLRYRPGAVEALRSLKSAGHSLTLYSARATPLDKQPSDVDDIALFYGTGVLPASVLDQWERFDEMRTFLQRTGMWAAFDVVWQSPGKPHVDVFIDDRFEEPDWLAVRRDYGGDLQ